MRWSGVQTMVIKIGMKLAKCSVKQSEQILVMDQLRQLTRPPKQSLQTETLTTVDAIVKAATFVTANTAQHGCTIEFWRGKIGLAIESFKAETLKQFPNFFITTAYLNYTPF